MAAHHFGNNKIMRVGCEPRCQRRFFMHVLTTEVGGGGTLV